MPLIKSKTKEARGKNIREMLSSYKEKGTIGNTKPKNMKHAIKIASAAAYSMQRKQRR